jgi:RNA polymerase sigma-70 factor, ECF subfamily
MFAVTGPAPAENSLASGTAERQPEALRGHMRVARAESAGHTWSFERIYDEYKTPIYNYIYHLVGNREQADDLTQDTFLKAFKALPKMDANLKLSAWLYRIATNTAYDALRRRKLIAWMPWQDLDHEPADVDSADPQETIGTTELVQAALKRMPRHYRAALLLYTQEGFSYAEIAATLSIAESGVKMYLSRARHSFREHYRALEQGMTPERATPGRKSGSRTVTQG